MLAGDRHRHRARGSARRCRSRSRRCSAPSFRCRCAPALYPGQLALALALWRADSRDLRAVAARPRPRRAGLGAVSRRDGAASRGCRDRAIWSATAMAAAALAALAVAAAYDRKHRDRSSSPAPSLVFGAAAADREPGDAGRAPRAAAAVDRAAARHRQHLPARRADADGRDLARPRARLARHRARGRRQSAPAIRPPRCRRRRRRSISSTSRTQDAERFDDFRAGAGAARQARCGCRCCAGGSWPRTAPRRRTSSPSPTPPGCCRATAASPTRPNSRPDRG